MNRSHQTRSVFNRAILCWIIVACVFVGVGVAQDLGESYPPQRPPTLLIPEAPSLSAADIEADVFLRIPDARVQFEVTGKGLCAVVIDSGINTKHISFAGKIITGANFSTDGGPGDMRDTDRDRQTGAIVPNGHGSNVAGIIAGNKLPMFEDIPTGIAYDAKIIPLKVFPGGSFSKVNEALKWVLDNRARVLEENHVLISVVNMSLGATGDNRLNDTDVTQAVLTEQRNLIKKLREQRVAVVVSAGNSYASFNPNQQGMSVPGIFKETVSVGAVYDTNLPANISPLPRTYVDGGTVKQAVAGRLTVFSQRLGLAAGGDFRTDICGPGFFVTSAGPEAGDDHTRSRTTQDGTSQAAPTISGMILLAQQRWRNRKAAATATPIPRDELPSVDFVEKALRDGGVVFQDVEDAVGMVMDNVEGSGDTFVHANAIGLLKQVDLATPSPAPATSVALRALQVELFGKSYDEQKRILREFREATGVFEPGNLAEKINEK
jgi:subtilisin family serine protease